MIVYLDSSVILRKFLGDSIELIQWAEWNQAYTSELAFVEGLRTIDQLRIRRHLTDEQFVDQIQLFHQLMEFMDIIKISSDVLKRASESFPTLIATLDAIHLSTAYLWREEYKKDMVFLTHDEQLGMAAKALAFEVQGIQVD